MSSIPFFLTLVCLSFSICFIWFLALPKKVFPLSKWGAGAKAMGKEKGVLGKGNMEENENNEVMVQPGGDLSPFPPRKCKKMEQGRRP